MLQSWDGNSEWSLLVQRSRTWRLRKQLKKLEGMEPERKFWEMLKVFKKGSLQMDDDKLPDKFRPLRWTEITLEFGLQFMPLQLQGVESESFQLWRLRWGSVREFFNSISILPSSFSDWVDNIMQLNIIVKCRFLWSPIVEMRNRNQID